MGTDGSVSYLFQKIGQITFAPGVNEEKVMEIALEANADDVMVYDDKSIDVTTSPEVFPVVKEAMEKAGLKPDAAEVTLAASVQVPITDDESAEKIMRLIDMLEDLDDTQEVYTNAEIAEDILAKL
jgi:transcriptional/translational regulatory protein YebC/TACO1